MAQSLTQEQILELLKGHQDVLTPMARSEENLLKATPCPQCGNAGCDPYVDPERPFRKGQPLPYKLLRCDSCGIEFDPQSRIILSVRRGTT